MWLKRMSRCINTSQQTQFYRGNGTIGLNNPFTAENSEWSNAGKGYEFTAYKLANGVIKLATNGTMTISTERVPELDLA